MEKPWGKIVEIAAPCLPLMRGAGRLVEDVVHVGIGEGCVKSEDAGSHLRWFFGSYTNPQKVNSF